VNDFFPRSGREGVKLGVFSARMEVVVMDDLSGVVVVGVGILLLSGCLRGDLKGVLKGDRNGLERVVDAASILRRLAAGVDILLWIHKIRGLI